MIWVTLKGTTLRAETLRQGPLPRAADRYRPRACQDPGCMAGGERAKLRLSAAAPRRQRHQRGSASDPQALESHRSTSPWRHKGWGPLLQGTGPAAGGSERRARPVRRLLSAPAGAAVWAAAGQGLRGAWPWEHREEAGDKIPEGPVRGVGRSRRLPLRAGRPGCG